MFSISLIIFQVSSMINFVMIGLNWPWILKKKNEQNIEGRASNWACPTNLDNTVDDTLHQMMLFHKNVVLHRKYLRYLRQGNTSAFNIFAAFKQRQIRSLLLYYY